MGIKMTEWIDEQIDMQIRQTQIGIDNEVKGIRAFQAKTEACANYLAVLKTLKEAREALHNLLQDTQHKNHDCGDRDCPVLEARRVLKQLDALGK